jgi:siroheme synthase
MGKAVAADVTTKLRQHGLDPDTPALIIENASLLNECTTFTSLARLGKTAKLTLGNGPALVLIGMAVTKPPASSLRRSLNAANRKPTVRAALIRQRA